MRATVESAREAFGRFNAAIFAGRLPEPVITLCEVTSFVAQYRMDAGRHILRFSTAFDLPQEEFEDTVIHEMLHYFISYNGLHDRSPHGPLFRALMQSVNETHGRRITVSRRMSQGELADARASARKKFHVIAVLHFTNGRLAVKVLPRVIPKIIDYYTNASRASNIASVDLYLHNDPYFNRFPTSVGRRCQLVTPDDLRTHLVGAHTLRVSGNRLIQT